MHDPATGTWFLPDVPWTDGNLVVALVHGATYFRRLRQVTDRVADYVVALSRVKPLPSS